MKRITYCILLVLLAGYVNAQISLEHNYNYSAAVVELETEGYKYYIMDVPAAQCRIYNLDHSVYKTINCTVPSGCYIFDIKFISEKLFDSDSEIELLYSWYKYYSGGEYYEYDSKIINEDGSEVLFIDGALYNYVNKAGEDTYKLFSYCYNFSSFPEVIWTNIYSLPGSPVVSAVFNQTNPEILLNAFPNPTSNTLKVTYSLPENVHSGILRLFDNSGRPVNQFTIDHFSDHLDLDISYLSQGVYHYFIEYENIRTPSKKLVIN